jgi:hypothetical protein
VNLDAKDYDLKQQLKKEQGWLEWLGWWGVKPTSRRTLLKQKKKQKKRMAHNTQKKQKKKLI